MNILNDCNRINRPTVSVVIPTYNTDKFIVETLNSVFAQTYSNFEVVLVDDASTDNTEELVESTFVEQIATGQLIYLKNEDNLERCRSRNKGVAESDGEFIAFLDADDLWQPNHLENAIEQITKSGCDLFITYMAWTNQDNSINPQEVIRRKTREYESEFANVEIDELISRGLVSNPSGYVMKKSTFVDAGGFSTDIEQREDWELIGRLYFKCRAKTTISLIPTHFLRIHSANTSGSFKFCEDTVKIKDEMIGYIEDFNYLENRRKRLLKSLICLHVSRVAFGRKSLKDGWRNLCCSVRLTPLALLLVLKRESVSGILKEFKRITRRLVREIRSLLCRSCAESK